MKIVTIGSATQDIFIEYENPAIIETNKDKQKEIFLALAQGTKIDVTDLAYHSGGGATNSAVSFKRLGFDVLPFFRTGDDAGRVTIMRDLARENISHALNIVDAHSATGISFILPSPTGDRTVLAFRGANAQIVPEEIPYAEIEKAGCVYITSLSGKSAQLLALITEYAQKHNVYVAVNPGASQLRAGAELLQQALKHIDIFMVNEQEAALLTRTLFSIQEPFNIPTFTHKILQFGPHMVVVTQDSKGVSVATKNKIYFHAGISTKPVSTLGAGDAFGSCFVASILQGYSVQDAMLRGIINSDSVLGFTHAKQGLLTKAELDERMCNYKNAG